MVTVKEWHGSVVRKILMSSIEWQPKFKILAGGGVLCYDILMLIRCFVVIVYVRDISDGSLIVYSMLHDVHGSYATSSECYTTRVLLFILFKGVLTYKGYHKLDTNQL